MSESDDKSLSVLLPEASVAVFSTHKDTLQAARALAQDWRFARVRIDIFEGDAIAAADKYASEASADLVIVQTDSIDEKFPQQLENLASNCSENSAAIVIGPVNDVYLYRRLIDMGVSDYLVRPVETKILASVIAKTLVERKGATGSNLIAFVGAKGGVGASVLATAAAWGVSDLMDQKTIMIDGAGGWSSLNVGLGYEPSTTLASAARATANNDEDSLKRMMFKASEKLSVLASGSDVMLGAAITDGQLESIIDTLMAKYPVVIADMSHATPDILRAVISRANQVVVVSTPTLPSLRLARTLMHEMKDLRGKEEKSIDLVINMQGIAGVSEVSRKDIETAMEMKISTIIPFAAKVFSASESEGKRIIDTPEGKAIVRTMLLPVLQKVLDADVAEDDTANKPKGGLLGSLLGKLSKR